MKKDKIKKIQRMLYIENELSKIKEKYSVQIDLDDVLNIEESLNFLYEKMSLEENITLDLNDMEYFNRACLIPLEEISKEVDRYDSSSPKLDELKFVDDLSKKYNVEIFMIIRRIKDVRKINQFKQIFDVLAIPCDRAYFVVPDKAEELINSKNSPEVRQQIEEMAETFRTNNLVKEKSVLKKTRKPNK